MCEIKAENQCLVSNHFQTNLFHLFSPFFFPSFSHSFSLPPPNANRGSRVMTSLLLLSCPNNAVKIRGRERKRNVTERGKTMVEKKKEMDRLIKKNPIEWAEVLICALMWMFPCKLDKYACCYSHLKALHKMPSACLCEGWRGWRGKLVTSSFTQVKIHILQNFGHGRETDGEQQMLCKMETWKREAVGVLKNNKLTI